MSNQQLSLQLVRVKCVDETGGKYVERWGNDEIWLAGTAVDASGEVVKLTEFEVYPHFDDGDTKEFSPPKTLFKLNVPGGTFPKSCEAILILAEKDEGGLTKLAEETFDKVTKDMKETKDEMGMGQGDQPPPGFWDEVSRKLKDVAYGYIRDEIASGLDDDVFPAQIASLSIPSEDFRWPDETKLSPEIRVEYRGHNGVYILVYYWEIETLESPRSADGTVLAPPDNRNIHP